MAQPFVSVDEQLRRACHELSRRLRAGQDCRAEQLLAEIPNVHQAREAALELLYTEFVVRQELGYPPDPQEWYRRFPQWRTDLEELFQIHQYVCDQAEQTPPAPRTTAVVDSADTRHDVLGVVSRFPAVDGYELLEEIGRGGMGVVYRGRQLRLNRIVALKLMLATELDGIDGSARFQNEVEAAASLQHPHIVQIFEAGEQDGGRYLAMEFVEGTSLEALLAKAPLTARSAAELLEPIAHAVQYAHEHGVIHRDLKPSNILLTRDGQPKIADLGLAKRFGSPRESNVTRTGVVLGTPSYMPPEQALGSACEIQPAADIYSLGAILYEMLTGRPPFVGDSALETLRQVQEDEPVSPRHINRAIPVDLETICLKCLEKQVASRYTTAAELADELRRYLQGEAIHARPARWHERCAKWARRRPAITALLAVILGITLLGTMAVVRQTRQALLETRINRATQRFFDDILASINPALSRGRSISVREMLDEASARLDATPDVHPRVQAALHDTLGATYARIDEPQAAEKHLRMAWQLYQKEKGATDATTLMMMSNLALTLEQLDRLDEAERMARQGLELAQQSLGSQHRVTHLFLTNLAVIADARGYQQEAEQLYRDEVSYYTKLQGADHPDALFAQSNLGAWLLNNDRPEDAEKCLSGCWHLQRQVLGLDHPQTLFTMSNLAVVLQKLGRAEESVRLGEQLLDLTRRVHGPTASITLRREFELAKVLMSQARADEALALAQHAFKELRSRLGNTHSQVLSATETIVMILGLSGRWEDAESIALRSHAEVASEVGSDHASTARMARLLANLYESWNRPEEQQRWEEVAGGNATGNEQSNGRD